MDNHSNPKLIRLFQTSSKVIGVIVTLIGCAVLIGWVFDISVLKSIYPKFISMKANTAFCFVLIGLSLVLLQNKKGSKLIFIFAAIIVLMSFLTLVEYILRWNLGIDQLICKEPPGTIGTTFPGRPAPNTVTNFLLIGIALLFLRTKKQQKYVIVQSSIFIVGIITFLAIIGYAYGIEKFIGIITPMALHTAVAFTLIFFGILFVQPDRGYMAIISSNTVGGIFARRLLPVAIIVPFCLGLLRVLGEKKGYFSLPVGTSLHVISIIIIFVTIILMLVKRQHFIDLARIKIEEEKLKLNSELTTLNKELEAFTYSVSHDLRAPLRHIDGFVELLTKQLSPTMDEKNRRYFSIISDSAKQMGKLIDDLLVLSHTGRAEMRTMTVNLGQLVKEIIDELGSETAGRDILWKISPLPEVQGDSSLLKQVLVNLLSNALKFNHTRKQARIEIGHTLNNDETIIFVRDNGVGFDMRYVDKLFGVFQRLHTTSEFEGTGIGLAIVQRIIQRHGGRTWAEGEMNQGATFYFSLPNLERKEKV